MSGLREELQRIYDDFNELTPKLVVDQARQKNHPLHTFFEWDNKIAGEKYRENQARKLIGKVRIAKENKAGEMMSLRAFHSVSRADSPSPTFMPLEEIVENPMTMQILLADMRREVAALKRRYGDMAQFEAIIRQELLGEEAA